MWLTDHERAFLAAFINEATTDPFKGPATEDLHRRNIYYTDVSHLLTAYYRRIPLSRRGSEADISRCRLPVPGQIEKPPFGATEKSKAN